MVFTRTNSDRAADIRLNNSSIFSLSSFDLYLETWKSLKFPDNGPPFRQVEANRLDDRKKSRLSRMESNANPCKLAS